MAWKSWWDKQSDEYKLFKEKKKEKYIVARKTKALDQKQLMAIKLREESRKVPVKKFLVLPPTKNTSNPRS